MAYEFGSQQKRPISLRDWARLMGFTFLVVVYIAMIERQWSYALGILALCVVLLAWWWRTPVDPRFGRDFSYV